jgi:hypothetical protein
MSVNQTSSSSSYSSTTTTEEEESSSQATTNKNTQKNQNEMGTILQSPLVSAESTKAMLKEIRKIEGASSLSSDSDADGMAFWSNHFAECPTVQEEKKINDNKKRTSQYTSGVYAQMDCSNIYSVNSIMAYNYSDDDNDVDDEEDDPEL